MQIPVIPITYSPLPLNEDLIRRLLRWAPGGKPSSATELNVFLTEHTHYGELEFARWAVSNDAPAIIAGIDHAWLGLMRRILHANFARERDARPMSQWTESQYPARQIKCVPTGFCNSHKELDGFVALKDDPIWASITPPNSWACTCLVWRAPSFGKPLREEAITPGDERLPWELVRRCVEWQDKEPVDVVARFRFLESLLQRPPREYLARVIR